MHFFLRHREVPLPSSSSSFSCPPQGQGEGTADTSDNNLFAPLLGFDCFNVFFLFCSVFSPLAALIVIIFSFRGL